MSDNSDYDNECNQEIEILSNRIKQLERAICIHCREKVDWDLFYKDDENNDQNAIRWFVEEYTESKYSCWGRNE